MPRATDNQLGRYDANSGPRLYSLRPFSAPQPDACAPICGLTAPQGPSVLVGDPQFARLMASGVPLVAGAVVYQRAPTMRPLVACILLVVTSAALPGAVLGQSSSPPEAQKQPARGPEQPAALTALLAAIQADMRTVPAGTFQMGDPSGTDSRALPVHRVTLRGFGLAAHQITLAQYDVFVAAVAPNLQGRPQRIPRCPSCDTQRVINVSWKDADAFITWLNQKSGHRYRLPTEAEWEYAARAGSNTNYPSGIPVDPTQSAAQQPSVGPSSANVWGLYDIVGSVGEWTEDCWHDSYAGAPTDGSAWVSGNCSRHVIRGGLWMGRDESQVVRISGRSFMDAAVFNGHTIPNLGFRLAESR